MTVLLPDVSEDLRKPTRLSLEVAEGTKRVTLDQVVMLVALALPTNVWSVPVETGR
jgi:hypothetical protein